ncbi:MAG: sigma-70 family RNA polymerase sigma factor [Clostridia bacterium]|nr:sigma-70 family RNA polymerase sigma factor [Clostridia bacterium]
MVAGSKTASNTVFEQCYKEYYQSLINFARARLREGSDFCEDCVQETFTVFYNRLQAGENFEYPKAFLYRTLDNIVKKQKAKIVAEEINTVSLDDPDNTIEIAVADEIDCEKCIKILENSLDEEEKFLYTEKYVNGKKIEQIAIESGLSVGAVTMRLSRLRKKLKNLLEDLLY